ncbi:MAG: MFS transporter [Tannerella sp.]|jgi:predicted MFS family arabinose efflux permease|nr:MFS transporter [Tannerella sp.]
MVVAMLFIVGVLNYLDRTMIVTMRQSILSDIPMTDAQFGLLTSVFLWVYGLLSPFAGFMADRFKRSYVITGSLFVWSVVTWLTAHATTYGELLTTRALMGVSEAFYIPAALALIVDYHKGRTQSLATGINLAGVMVGQSLGFIGGWLAENHSWNYAFNILGLIGICYSVFLCFTLKDTDNQIIPGKKEEKVALRDAMAFLFKRKSFICLLLAFGLMGVVTWMVIGWLPTYYMEKFHLSQSISGLYATTYLYPASIAGLLLGGFLADRWSKTNPRARLLIPIIGLSIAAFFVFFAAQSEVLILVISFLLVFGLTRTFFDANVMPSLCLMVDPHYRATGYGILNMLSTFVGGAGIYIAGLLRDSHINLNVVYQFASLIIVVCAGLLWIAKQQIKKK